MLVNQMTESVEEKLATLGVPEKYRTAYADMFRNASDRAELLREIQKRNYSLNEDQILYPLFRDLRNRDPSAMDGSYKLGEDCSVPSEVVQEYFSATDSPWIKLLKHPEIPGETRKKFVEASWDFMLQKIRSYLGVC